MTMESDIYAGQGSSGDVGSVEEFIPLPKRVVLGAQQALVSNAWLDPIFIASVAGFSAGLATNLVSATFLASGLVTFVQSTKLVRLPIVQGPSSAFSPLAIGYYKAGTMASAGLGLFIGAALVFLAAISGQFAKIRTVLSKSVAGAIITLVGFINIPIIKFSVDWWNTLHQPASVFRLDGPTIDPSLLWPLLVMAVGFTVLFFALHLMAMRTEIRRRRVAAMRRIAARNSERR